MKIRNKETKQVYTVPDGSLIPSFYEVVDEFAEIMVGEPTFEYEIEKPAEKKKTARKTTAKKATAKKEAK